MQRRDFDAAQKELENAFVIDPDHRGIRKSLGYAYVWGDKLERAERLLGEINEAKSEMEVYTWWWKENDRSDLSSQANELVKILDAAP
jgi:predicted Zn-dependent protease